MSSFLIQSSGVQIQVPPTQEAENYDVFIRLDKCQREAKIKMDRHPNFFLFDLSNLNNVLEPEYAYLRPVL